MTPPYATVSNTYPYIEQSDIFYSRVIKDL